NVVAHIAIAFVHDSDAVEADLGAAEVAVVGAGVFAVVELDIDHGCAFKADPGLHDTVLGGDFKAVHRGVGGNGRLAVGGGSILVARLRALQRAPFDDEGRDNLVPNLGGLCALKVI